MTSVTATRRLHVANQEYACSRSSRCKLAGITPKERTAFGAHPAPPALWSAASRAPLMHRQPERPRTHRPEQSTTLHLRRFPVRTTWAPPCGGCADSANAVEGSKSAGRIAPAPARVRAETERRCGMWTCATITAPTTSYTSPETEVSSVRCRAAHNVFAQPHDAGGASVDKEFSGN